MAYKIAKELGFEGAMLLLYEEAMREERERYREKHPEDPSNGHYRRVVKIFGREEEVKVPRTRKGGFRSSLLPERWKRNEEVGGKLIKVLLSMGYSRGAVKIVLGEYGIKARDEEMKEFEEKMRLYIEGINTAPIEEDMAFIYLDGHRMKIRTDRGVKVYTLYIVIGINEEGKKRFLYVEIDEGVERASKWVQILKLLVGRGLKKPLMFITDDLTGLSEAIESIFPEADHQICLIHLFRSLKRNLPKGEAANMIRFIKAEKARAGDHESTVSKFTDKVAELGKKHPKLQHYLNSLIDNARRYWAFLKYPPAIHKRICSTNPIESVFRQVKKMEYNNMGFLASLDYAYFSVAIVLERISSRWRKSSHTIIGLCPPIN
jgi:transposase-like protein